MNISELIGKTITGINGMKNGSDEVFFTTSDNKKFKMFHWQDCCEHVQIEDVCGDVSDIIGSPVVVAEEITGDTAQPSGWKEPEYCESYTWTFYKIDTVKGGITIRWLGESNGYYGEGVDFEEI